ncbi:shikimate dehydrogenase [Planococcus sp. ISL-109]|uniref:shikimate dehydrogenase n=1 Tax=Planococcus sp. ISL-109 TaxID=2819166 RepID=UPI001BE75230|nr:shikimate dehydrogenase [Planococcus sp. ISL-109]MBT2582366.1 shikimate dehydrogenase [Planococcus sp. ISL-109]
MKKWYAVIGDPISHSLSPFMHDHWFQKHDIDASYIPFHVEPAQLEQAISSMKLLGISGFNITLPHKQAVIPLLDQLDETAQHMNAVNTVVAKDRRFKGFNTDGDGFVRSLLSYPVAKGNALLIIGAGGAARGIAFALERAGFTDISITNRTFRRAQELAEETGSKALVLADAEAQLSDFSTIIQTTSVGLTEEALPLSLTHLGSGAVVADIIYNPLETPFLKEAKAKDCLALNGVGMFVNQGAIAFEKWTGIRPDTEEMIQLITDKLGGNYVNS